MNTEQPEKYPALDLTPEQVEGLRKPKPYTGPQLVKTGVGWKVPPTNNTENKEQPCPQK